MKQVRIQCIDCGKLVIVSPLQSCFYCGKIYKQDDIDRLLEEAKAEVVEVEKLLEAQGPAILPPAEVPPPKWRKLVYTAAVLFFFVFCAMCILLIVKFL
jgi:hypothetical protein